MSIINLIKRRPVATYFVLAYLVTWTSIALVVGPQNILRGTISSSQFMLIWAAMLLGSGGVGLLLTGALDGRAGLRALAAGIGRWRVGWRWYLPLLINPLVVGAALAVLTQTSPAFTPGILTAPDKVTPLVMFLVVAFGTFVEEFGWTGFAARHLWGRYNWLTIGLGVGVLWAGWHFMGDLIGSRAVYGPLFLLHFLAFWLVPLTAFRVLIVWVYRHTQSLPLAMLMHASYSPVLFVLGPTAMSSGEAVTYETTFTLMLCLVTLVVVLLERRRHASLPLPRVG